MKPKLAAILALAITAFLLLSLVTRGEELSAWGNPCTTVSLGGVKVKAEVVTSPVKIYLGLSYRQELPEGCGMLFVMPAEEVQVFCMRGMRFPLDIIWLGHERVAGLEKNVSPQYSGELSSPAPVGYVLEVPGGFCDRHGIKVGDRVSWQTPLAN
jgi:uncharacterized membrane protein (UPF0127 family)